MKKIFGIAIIAFAIILPGCKTGNGGNPKDTLTNFFNALAKKDVAEAKKFATADSDGMLSMIAMGFSQASNEHEDKMIELMKNFELGEPVIKGDEATINVKDKKTGEATDFVLKKEKGDWKVAFDMGTLMEMGRKKMQEHGLNMDSVKKEMNQAMDSLNSSLPEAQQKLQRAKEMMDSAKKAMDAANSK